MASSEAAACEQVAAAVAGRIARTAIWSQDRCNWVATAPSETSPATGARAVEAALGPDLYSGTAGIAVFLAEAAIRRDDDGLRATALGAVRHAVLHAADIDPRKEDGLLRGRLGVAYAAARVADRLRAEAAMRDARRLVRTWQRDRQDPAGHDIVAGTAGAVTALLVLADLLDDDALVDAAAALGEKLIAAAEQSPAGWSWTSARTRAMWNLCGYSHGAAGIGHALIELYAATGEERFGLAGERAYDYERSWFDSRSGAWADLRGISRRSRPVAAPDGLATWCNGAAGIALSRMRAARLSQAPAVHRDAELALRATARSAAALLDAPSEDFSLCHGAAGIGDALVYAGSPLAAAIGRLGIERHGQTDGGFPCGTPSGRTPSLFLGEAGVGLFYLRLVEPTVPTPLIVHS